jgi:uncharacterized Fe-S cluster-containing radical SAM superfamily protein
MLAKTINTEAFSAVLRDRAIDKENQRVLITKFEGSKQALDLSLPANCGGFGRIHHFRRDQGPDWPLNRLPIDPALHYLGQELKDVVQVQVFQNAVCSWRCWYCFVDFDLLSGNRKHSEFKSAGELLDLYLQETNAPRVIDLSGGQPDLVPEWSLWMLDEISARGLSSNTYVWSDDNLSNDYLWRFLRPSEINRITSYGNYSRVGCFKGFDSTSFSFNTSAEPEAFDQQFRLMRRLVAAGFDVYGYATFTSPDGTGVRPKMSSFVDRLQQIHELFPLRLVPLRIREFTPMMGRMTTEHKIAMEVQQEAAIAWREELSSRYSEEALAKPIYQNKLV